MAFTPTSSSHNRRLDPTSPLRDSAGMFSPVGSNLEALLVENERMLAEIDELRAANSEVENLRLENERLRTQNDVLERKVLAQEEVIASGKAAVDALTRNDESIRKIGAYIDEIRKQESANAAAARSRSASTERQPEDDVAALRREVEKHRMRAQDMMTQLSTFTMFLEQSKLENKHLTEKNQVLASQLRTARDINSQLIAKYGVSREEGARIQAEIDKATAGRDPSHGFHVKLDELLNTQNPSREQLNRIVSEIYDERDKFERVLSDRLTAATLNFREKEDQLKAENARLSRRVSELESDVRNVRLTLRQDGDGRALATPRNWDPNVSNRGGIGAPSSSPSPAAASAAGSPSGVLGNSVVSTPRMPSTAGYSKKCPVCTFSNQPEATKCQVCSKPF